MQYDASFRLLGKFRAAFAVPEEPVLPPLCTLLDADVSGGDPESGPVILIRPFFKKNFGDISMKTKEETLANHGTDLETLDLVEFGDASEETRGSWGFQYDGGPSTRH